jgi:hypothetical protein
MRELLAFLGLDVPMKYVDQFGMEGVYRKNKYIRGKLSPTKFITEAKY